MNRKKNSPGLGRRWRILRNLGITALLGVALWAGRGFPLPTAELRFEWAQRGALMADPAPLQGQVGSELVGANGRDIVVYSEGSWKIRTFPRTPGPALVPLSDGVVAVDVPEGTASARLVMTLSLYYEELPGGNMYERGYRYSGVREGEDWYGEPQLLERTYEIQGEQMAAGGVLFPIVRPERGDSTQEFIERTMLDNLSDWDYDRGLDRWKEMVNGHMTAVFCDESGAELGRAELETTDF